jgi:hypothetical protein
MGELVEHPQVGHVLTLCERFRGIIGGWAMIN